MKQCPNVQCYYFRKNLIKVCDGCIHNISLDKGLSGTYGNENNLSSFKDLNLEGKYYGFRG